MTRVRTSIMRGILIYSPQVVYFCRVGNVLKPEQEESHEYTGSIPSTRA